jgi:Mrr N-terminal domain
MTLSGKASPARRDLRDLVVRAVQDLGGRATRGAVRDRALELGEFTADEMAQPSAKPGMSQIEYHMGWALSELKNDGRLFNPQRGIWSTTEQR